MVNHNQSLYHEPRSPRSADRQIARHGLPNRRLPHPPLPRDRDRDPPPENPLAKQHSVSDYVAATGSPPNLKGFIFLETDRKHDLEAGVKDASGWEFPLMEVSWLRRIAEGKPRDGEGHGEEHKDLCLGIIPWAPLPSGAEAMQKYLDHVKEVAGEHVWPKIRGFRYLLQDKPHGTGLTDDFIDSLKLLRVPEEEKVTFIINHLCKPDLGVINTTDPSFIYWRTSIFALSACSKTYIKLSGGFSEMPDSLKKQDPNALFEALFPWLGVVLATFGPRRTMSGSDWPVCTVGVDEAWRKWKLLVERMCYMATMDPEDQAELFGGTALRAYGLTGFSLVF
uniref:Amidohydrolase family protein n=1 Tax=Colletotrichum fructicola (strain Nara gc5) TaxID=1213859 RepID=L2G2X9_COLFN